MIISLVSKHMGYSDRDPATSFNVCSDLAIDGTVATWSQTRGAALLFEPFNS